MLTFPSASGNPLIPIRQWLQGIGDGGSLAAEKAGGPHRTQLPLDGELQSSDDQHLLQALIELTLHHHMSLAIGPALGAADHAVLIARRLDNPIARGHALWSRAFARQGSGLHSDALDDAMAAQSVFDRNDKPVASGWSKIALAGVHHDLGDKDGASRYLSEAVSVGKQFHDDRLLATASHALGRTTLAQGKIGQAVDYANQSLDLRFHCGGSTEVIQSLHLLGEIAVTQLVDGSVDEAKLVADASRHYMDAAALAWRDGNRNYEATLAALLAELQLISGKPEAAVDLVTTVLPDLGQLDNTAGLGRLHLALANSYDALDQPEKALEVLSQATLLTSDTSAQLEQAWHSTLAKLHERLGHFSQALAHFKAAGSALERDRTVRLHNAANLRAIQLRIEQSRREATLLRSGAAALQAELRDLQVRSRRLGVLAREDWLTGLANRRTLDEWLTEAVRLARIHLRPLVVALADIDHFKAINDTYSHQAGDAVLRETAAILRRHVRRLDLVARYGGEEFALAFPDATLDQAGLICERIRRDVEGNDWSGISPDLQVTLSIGLADGALASSAQEALAEADQRMYQAKHDGRNAVYPRPLVGEP